MGQVKVDLQVREQVSEIEGIEKTVETTEEIGEVMETTEEIGEITETTEEITEITETTEEIGERTETTEEVGEIMETTEEMEAMEGMGDMEEEVKSRDTHESMAQGEIRAKVKITWMIIALLKSMELLHPNMDTALEGGMVETEATNLPLREVTIRPPYAAITRQRRSHNEVMERTEATRQRGVTTRPPSEATIQPPGNTTQQPNQRSINHLRPHQRSMEDPRSMGSRPRKCKTDSRKTTC